jgi:hypothetical protein
MKVLGVLPCNDMLEVPLLGRVFEHLVTCRGAELSCFTHREIDARIVVTIGRHAW